MTIHFESSRMALKGKNSRETAYMCENYVCNLPTADPHVVARLLDQSLSGEKEAPTVE